MDDCCKPAPIDRTSTARAQTLVLGCLAVLGAFWLSTNAWSQSLATEANLRLLRDHAVQSGRDPARYEAWLQQAQRLTSVQRLILPPSTPGQRSWSRYRARFVDPVRIQSGLRFWAEWEPSISRVAQDTGVPGEILVAILGVETVYGRFMGEHRVLDSLATLGFEWPIAAPRDRSAFFREQWFAYLDWALAEGLNPTQMLGSFAGAMGLPQFMPGNIPLFGRDGDGDGRIDLIGSVPDALASIAQFLLAHGWMPEATIWVQAELPGEPAALVAGGITPSLSWGELEAAGTRSNDPMRLTQGLGVINLVDEVSGQTEYRLAGNNFFAITHYNRSYFYAAAVADLATELRLRRAR